MEVSKEAFEPPPDAADNPRSAREGHPGFVAALNRAQAAGLLALFVVVEFVWLAALGYLIAMVA